MGIFNSSTNTIKCRTTVGNYLYAPFGREAYKSLTPADAGYVGELASEAMTFEDNLVQALEAAGGSFDPQHFPHLFLPEQDKLALQDRLGGVGTYLDKGRYSDLSTRSLGMVLASMEELGVDHDLLSRTVGGEETIDTTSKQMVAAFGRAKDQILVELRAANLDPDSHLALEAIAQRTADNLAHELNTMLTGSHDQIVSAFGLNNARGQGLLRRMASPGAAAAGGRPTPSTPGFIPGGKAAVDHWWEAGAGSNRGVADMVWELLGVLLMA